MFEVEKVFYRVDDIISVQVSPKRNLFTLEIALKSKEEKLYWKCPSFIEVVRLFGLETAYRLLDLYIYTYSYESYLMRDDAVPGSYTATFICGNENEGETTIEYSFDSCTFLSFQELYNKYNYINLYSDYEYFINGKKYTTYVYMGYLK